MDLWSFHLLDQDLFYGPLVISLIRSRSILWTLVIQLGLYQEKTTTNQIRHIYTCHVCDTYTLTTLTLTLTMMMMVTMAMTIAGRVKRREKKNERMRYIFYRIGGLQEKKKAIEKKKGGGGCSFPSITQRNNFYMHRKNGVPNQDDQKQGLKGEKKKEERKGKEWSIINR